MAIQNAVKCGKKLFNISRAQTARRVTLIASEADYYDGSER